MPSGSREVNGIAATVNGFVVTKKEVAFAMAPNVAELTAQFPRRGPEFEKRLKETYEKTLDDFVDRELIMSEFKHLGGKIRAQAIDEEVERQKRERYNGNDALFRENLSKAGLTIEGFRNMTERQLIVQAMRAAKFNDAAPPLPHEIQKEYNEVKLKMRDTSGDKITFHKIYIPAVDPKNSAATPDSQLDLADSIVKQLKDGANFEELAKQHSRDAFAEQGGKQENVPRTDLAPEFATLIMDPPEGTIIGPLMDPRGLTIVKVLQKTYGPIPPLSKVHDQIEQRVARQKSAERYERWIKSLRAKGMINRKQ
jgi:peptidyl-prolyl cis-trans isomerase SurA